MPPRAEQAAEQRLELDLERGLVGDDVEIDAEANDPVVVGPQQLDAVEELLFLPEVVVAVASEAESPQ